MKKYTKYLFTSFLILCITGIITACKEQPVSQSEPTLIQLPIPKSAHADFWELSWESVEHATGYSVKIEKKEYLTTDTSFLLFDYLAPETEYQITLTALGDGVTYSDSISRPIKYKTESVTPNLDYKLLEDDTYEVSCPKESIPKNGELVLPNFYQKKLVTSFSYHDYNTKYTDIEKIRLPKKLKTIQDKALSFSSITELYIPNSVESISGFNDSTLLTSIRFPENLKCIATNAFNGCTSLQEVNIPESVTKIGSSAFSGCPLTRVDLPNNLKSLSGFQNCSLLTSINIPESVTEIGPFAFSGCPLSQIDFPKTLTRIDRFAFYGCPLSEIQFPDSITSIGTNAFEETPWYEKQSNGLVYCGNVLYTYKGIMPEHTVINNLPNTLKGFRDEIFLNRTELISITIPNGVQEIPHSAFSGCSNLEHVTLPNTLVSIGISAFYNCISLSTMNLTDNLTLIGEKAFSNTAFTGINLPNGMKYLLPSSFANCKSLTSVFIPGSIEALYSSTFSGCENLQNVQIENGVQKMEARVFSGCTSLTKIELPNSLQSLSLSAFQNTGITRLEIPPSVTEMDGKVKQITEFILPKNIPLIDYNIFYTSIAPVIFYFMGDTEDWENVEINKTYTPPPMMISEEQIKEEQAWMDAWAKTLTVAFYSEIEPWDSKNNYWHYDEDGNPVMW